MILAGMVRTDETALICDLAETYGILDYRALPLKTAAALASGLRENSRIMMAMDGRRLPTATLLMAASLDRLTTLAWMKTKDGLTGRNRPASVLDMLTGRQEKKDRNNDVQVFHSAEDFRAAWERATKKEV